jgi:hypothetical protein
MLTVQVYRHWNNHNRELSWAPEEPSLRSTGVKCGKVAEQCMGKVKLREERTQTQTHTRGVVNYLIGSTFAAHTTRRTCELQGRNSIRRGREVGECCGGELKFKIGGDTRGSAASPEWSGTRLEYNLDRNYNKLCLSQRSSYPLFHPSLLHANKIILLEAT